MTDSISNGGCCAGSVRPGTYGNAYDVAQITVDKCGRITRVTNVPISGGGGGSSQWTGITGNPIYYVPNVGIGSSVTPTAKLQVTGNVYVSNAVTTANVHVTDTLDVLGSMTANAANATFFFDTFTIPYINTQYLNVSSNTTLTGNISMYGDAYVSDSLSAARYYGDGGLLSNISSSGFTQPLPNLVVSNSVTTSNIYVANTFQVDNTFFANTTTVDMNFNTLSITYINTSNIVVSNLIASTGNINMYGNVYVSNAVTVPNIHVTDTLDVLGSMTANAANATFFFDTFTIPYINTQYLNVSSDTTLTGNLVVSTANIATLNVGYLTVNSAVVYGASTLNVYGMSNLTNVVASGNVYIGPSPSTVKGTLHVEQGDVFIGNSAVTGTVSDPTATSVYRLAFDNASRNTTSPNKIVLYSNSASGNVAGLSISTVAQPDVPSVFYLAGNHYFLTKSTSSLNGYQAMFISADGQLNLSGSSSRAHLDISNGNLPSSNVQVRIDSSNVALVTSGAGLVGFGTTIPTANLHVIGNVYVSNALSTTNVFATNDVVIGPSPVALQANLHVEQGDVFIGNSAITNTNFTTTGPVNRLIFDNSANTSVVPNKIVLFSNSAAGIYAGLGIGNANGTSVDLTYRSRTTHIFYTGPGATTEQMRLTSAGAVSIGSSAINAKLYVNGFPSTNNTSVRIDSSNIALVTSGSGLVGFGTLTPSANLHVIGNIYASNAVTTTNVFATQYYGDAGFLSNISSSSIVQPFANLVVSNTVTTTNIVAAGFTSNATNTVFNFDTLTIPFINSTTLNVASTSNLQVATLIGLTGATTLNVTGNIYASNALSTTNVFAANAVTTTNVFAATANVGTLNVWQVSNLLSLSLTNNLYAANALTTTNVFTTNVTVTTITGSTANTLTIASNVTTFQSNGAATVMTLTNGNVGIGTTNPQVLLAAAGTCTLGPGASTTTAAYHAGMVNILGGGTRALLRIENNGSVGSPGIIFGEGGGFTEDTQPTVKKVQGTNNLAIMCGGNVGIGTTNPGYPLVVNYTNTAGGLNETGIYINNTSKQNSSQVSLASGNVFSIISNGSLSGNSFQIFNVSRATTPFTILPNGNVGIGTTSPSYPLHIAGSDVTISGAASNVNMTRGAVFFTAVNDWNHVLYNNGLNRDGLGTLDGMRWMVQNGLQIYAGNRSSVPSLSGIALSIDSSSRVGIGTSSPLDTLQVTNSSGIYTNTENTGGNQLSLRHSGANGTTLYMGADNTNNIGYIQAVGSSALKPIVLQGRGGNVGIGAVSPGYKLDVAGDIYSSGRILINNTTATSTSAKVSINGDTGVNGAIQIVATNTGDRNVDAIGCRAAVDSNFIINCTNTSGSYRGGIQGVNSTTVFYATSSDARMKSNVVDMPSIIDRIKQLRPCNFVWKESGDKGDGFIAQEVFAVFPQMRNGVLGYCNVCSHTYNELYDGNLCSCCDFENPIDKDGNPRYYGLDYGRFTPYLTKGLQETIDLVEKQAERIARMYGALQKTMNDKETLETTVATLVSENIQLKDRLDSLEARLTAAGF